MSYYLQRIGDSKFFWNIPYDVKEIPEEMNIKDDSWLANVTNPGDRTTKNTVSFMCHRYKTWNKIGINFHSYPDKDTETYNPEVRFDRELLDEKKIQWVIDFLNKNATGVNKTYLNMLISYQEDEIKKAHKIINRINFASEQFK